MPIANDTRLAANVVAFSADNVETSPPNNTINAPNGKKYSADSIIPNSPNPPINSQDGIPITSGFKPPMKTKVKIMYVVTTIASDNKIASRSNIVALQQ